MHSNKTDVDVKVKRKKQLLAAAEAYAALDKMSLEQKCMDIAEYLLLKGWHTDLGKGKWKAFDGTPYNLEDWFFASAKMELVELEFRKRYPNTFDGQLTHLYSKAQEKVGIRKDPLEILQ